jgi:hypothetical protein
MSEDEALTRFYYWCAVRHRKAETRRLWRRRCVMHGTTITFDKHFDQIRLLRRRRIYTSAPAID